MPFSPESPIPAAIERTATWWVDTSLSDYSGRAFNATQRKRMIAETGSAMKLGALIGWCRSSGDRQLHPKAVPVFDGLWKGTWATIAQELAKRRQDLIDPDIVEELDDAVVSMTQSLLSLRLFARRGVSKEEIEFTFLLLRGAILAGFCMELVRCTPETEFEVEGDEH